MSVLSAANVSIDDHISQAATYGEWRRFLWLHQIACTAATANSGAMSIIRFPIALSYPSVGAGVIGVKLTSFDTVFSVFSTDAVRSSCLEYVLATFKAINKTFTVNSSTDVFTCSGHGMSNNDQVRFSTTTTLPAPLSASTTYYVIAATTNTFQVALTAGGSAVDLTTTGTGTQTVVTAMTPGVVMPTKIIRGVSCVTAAANPVMVATAAVTGTTAAVTITYTNQSAATGKTAALTFPTSPLVNSGFRVHPHFTAGDLGLVSIQDISLSGGTFTAGTFTVYGLLPLFENPWSPQTAGGASSVGLFSKNTNCYIWEPGETLAFYTFGSVLLTDLTISVSGIAES